MHAKQIRKGRGLAVAALGLVASACVQQRAEPVTRREEPRRAASEAHAAPRITSTFQSELSLVAGRAVTLRVVASDPQARGLSIRWAASTGTLGEPAREATQSEVEWTPPPCVLTGTTPSITATVTNALGLSAETTFTVTGGTTCLAGGGGARILSLHSESVAWNAR
ncbi:hypothetical protein [Hyalangium rubrum]|uniref:Ig-like domain-containing protein n=1 Tax=Hyalangium rubrum TaxID=3103134 RepID=A0ABU5HDQ4_9BACT|nr:hypothetical protein [Hyalangium sp. s54d21]MDY7231262.1 hypothetical protein [Hyalangium sp. s54d21]